MSESMLVFRLRENMGTLHCNENSGTIPPLICSRNILDPFPFCLLIADAEPFVIDSIFFFNSRLRSIVRPMPNRKTNGAKGHQMQTNCHFLRAQDDLEQRAAQESENYYTNSRK